MRRAVALLLEHFGVALAIGLASAWWFGDWRLILVALATGWLIDADHLVDFSYYVLRRRGRRLERSLFTSGAYFNDNGKVIVPLHSWELVAAWALWWVWAGETGIAIAGAAAWALHLAQDQQRYRVVAPGYLFSYRASRSFTQSGFCKT